MITFNEFLVKVDKEYFSRPCTDKLRYGQILMNELYNVWPDKYHEITGSEYDCFYNDDNISLILGNLRKFWNNRENI